MIGLLSNLFCHYITKKLDDIIKLDKFILVLKVKQMSNNPHVVYFRIMTNVCCVIKVRSSKAS